MSEFSAGGRAPPPRSKTPSTRLGSRLRPRWLRHPQVSPYRCFLPDLTGFRDPSCAGPDLQRRLPRPVLRTQTSAMEFGPAKADCRFSVPPAPHLARPPASLPGLRRPGRPAQRDSQMDVIGNCRNRNHHLTGVQLRVRILITPPILALLAA